MNKKVYKAKRRKTPTLIQMEAVECGAASLGIILGYNKLFVPLEKLRVDCGVSRDGSKASNVITAAEKYGLIGRGYMIQDVNDLSELFDEDMPVIVFWEMNHFLVLEGVKKNKVYLNDPAYGPRIVTLDEFKQSYSKVYLTFEKTEKFIKGKDKQNVFLLLMERLKDSKLNLLYAFLVTLLLIAPGIVMPAISKIFIDDYLIKGKEAWFAPIMVAFAVVAFVMMILTWMQKSIFINLETKINLVGSYSFMWHLLRLPIRFFSLRSPGDLISRLHSNSTIASLLSGGVTSTLFNMVQVVFYGFFMFLYCWQLTLLVVFFSMLNVVVYYATKRIKRDVNFRVQDAGAKLSSATMLGNKIIESLKFSGNESDFFTTWAARHAKFINSYQQSSWLSMMTSLIPIISSQLSNALVLGVGCYLIIKGEFSIGNLVAFTMISGSFKGPIMSLVTFGSSLQQIDVDIKRLNDVYNYNIDEKFSKPKKLENSSKVKFTGYLELRNITFGYNCQEPPLIENFNLTLKPGSRVALVGSSGSGKSTVAKLITGLFNPWAGEILIDNIPIKEIPSDILTNSLSMVNQELFFFRGSVKENLTMWDYSIPENIVTDVAKIACIYDEIAMRPRAFDSDVYENGSNFSGGQLQRMEIARALINDPSILILDEASSALDPVVETRIDRNLRTLGCSTIVIAHRVSTVRDCDEIIVLDKGKVVERGIHNELIDKNGYYCELVKAE